MSFLKRSSLVFIFCIIPTFYSAFSMEFRHKERREIETIADGFAEEVFDHLITDLRCNVEFNGMVDYLVGNKKFFKGLFRQSFNDFICGQSREIFSRLRGEGADVLRTNIAGMIAERAIDYCSQQVLVTSPDRHGMIFQDPQFHVFQESIRTAAIQALQKLIKCPRSYGGMISSAVYSSYKLGCFGKELALCIPTALSAVAVYFGVRFCGIKDFERAFWLFLMAFLLYKGAGLVGVSVNPEERIKKLFKSGEDVDFKALLYHWIQYLVVTGTIACYVGRLFRMNSCHKLFLTAAMTLLCKGFETISGISLNPWERGKQLKRFIGRKLGY